MERATEILTSITFRYTLERHHRGMKSSSFFPLEKIQGKPKPIKCLRSVPCNNPLQKCIHVGKRCIYRCFAVVGRDEPSENLTVSDRHLGVKSSIIKGVTMVWRLRLPRCLEPCT